MPMLLRYLVISKFFILTSKKENWKYSKMPFRPLWTGRHNYAFEVRGTIYFVCNLHVANLNSLSDSSWNYHVQIEKPSRLSKTMTNNTTQKRKNHKQGKRPFCKKKSGFFHVCDLHVATKYLNLNSLTYSLWNYHVQIEKPSRLGKTMSRHFLFV